MSSEAFASVVASSVAALAVGIARWPRRRPALLTRVSSDDCLDNFTLFVTVNVQF